MLNDVTLSDKKDNLKMLKYIFILYVYINSLGYDIHAFLYINVVI